jgi:hypothetical protein
MKRWLSMAAFLTVVPAGALASEGVQADIRYVLGGSEPRLPAAHVMKPREEWTSGGLVVRTTGSTDEGVGFLVSVDGLTLYHAGDHARYSSGAVQRVE